MPELPSKKSTEGGQGIFRPLVWDQTGVDSTQVCTAGSWYVQPAGAPLHRHLILEILWNEAPMRLRFLERQLTLRRPTVAILPAGTLHIAEPVGARHDKRRIGRDLSIRQEALQGAGEKSDLRFGILPAAHGDLVLPVLRHIHARLRSPHPPAHRDLAEILAGLCALLRDLGYTASRPAPVVKTAIDRALDVLYRRHVDPSLRVQDLARAAGLSEPHFRRLFLRQTGRPPHRMLARLRVFHAVRLMEQRHMKAEAVARETGFGSVSAMYKQLRRHRQTS